MKHSLDSLIDHGLPAMQGIARRLRLRVMALAQRRHEMPAAKLVSLARVEIAKAEPVFARVITDSLIAAWLAAARPIAQDATPKPDKASLRLYQPPSPPRLPPALQVAPESDPDPVVRFPGVEHAVRDLTARRVMLPGEYDLLDDEARGAAYTVARVMSRAAVGEVRDAIVDDVGQGGTLREFRSKVADAIDGALSPSQVETIYRTQVGQAHGAGLRAILEHDLVADEFPGISWNATHDSRVRPEHLQMETWGIDGTNCYWADDPVIQAYFPPAGYNCRCVASPMTLEDMAAAGVKEAKTWLRTGKKPARRTFVPHPPFELPKGWPRGGGIQPVL